MGTYVWHDMRDALTQRNLFGLGVKPDRKIDGEHYDYVFKAGWQNGVAQVLEPISFDLQRGRSIVDKAAAWAGRLVSLSGDFQLTAVVQPPGGSGLKSSFEDATGILGDNDYVRAVVDADSFEDFVPEIEMDLATDRKS